jgi:hypothetical protein
MYVERGEALGEAPVPVCRQLHQQEAGTSVQAARRSRRLHTRGLSGEVVHHALVSKLLML